MDTLCTSPALNSGPSSRLHSPQSDARFWNALQCRVDGLLANPEQFVVSSDQHCANLDRNEIRTARMKEDSLLLLKGFDSVSDSLSQLSSKMVSALQAARRLAEPPTLSEMLQKRDENLKGVEKAEDEDEVRNKRLKRQRDESCENEEDSLKDVEEVHSNATFKKAKKVTVIVAKMAMTLAKELKSLKSEFLSTQDRCLVLEEENRRLLQQSNNSIISPDEDDMMRLQMEVLLAEKSRLASENANLVRENQCLHQLVQYHQLTSQDISETYEEVLRGVCLDFSSPPSTSAVNEDSPLSAKSW